MEISGQISIEQYVDETYNGDQIKAYSLKKNVLLERVNNVINLHTKSTNKDTTSGFPLTSISIYVCGAIKIHNKTTNSHLASENIRQKHGFCCAWEKLRQLF